MPDNLSSEEKETFEVSRNHDRMLVYMYVCMCVYVCTCMYVCMYVCMYPIDTFNGHKSPPI